jgi:hypothetical protein
VKGRDPRRFALYITRRHADGVGTESARNSAATPSLPPLLTETTRYDRSGRNPSPTSITRLGFLSAGCTLDVLAAVVEARS